MSFELEFYVMPHKRRKKRSKKLKIWLVIIVLVVAGLSCAFLFAGRFLVYNQPPKKADVIIVLSGDKGSRLEKAVSLYKLGYAPKIMVSGGIVYYKTTLAQLMIQQATSLGVPRSALISENQSNTTYENGTNTLKEMKSHHFTSAIIVSSDYHMRRVHMIFTRIYRDSNITLTFCAAKDPHFNPNRWWSNNKSAMDTVTEYIKYIGYLVEFG